ncbi:Neuronal pentraxin-1 [Desmophyllum pertusum]|uniref:Neuronal pentraxin-1 n=1 Tax=Desmophyllum pertusum TaxID=174260 RepID=A0A9W9Z9I7_9CNID|nr:Neuronal pentraxin-1 [Desmophyllum pertusum]
MDAQLQCDPFNGLLTLVLMMGQWHHICFTWSGDNGYYEFFKDGVSVGSGSGFYKGGHITSGGPTMIGQDQDTVGGGFDAAQAFVGDVAQVNVWDTVLSESDIKA